MRDSARRLGALVAHGFDDLHRRVRSRLAASPSLERCTTVLRQFELTTIQQVRDSLRRAYIHSLFWRPWLWIGRLRSRARSLITDILFVQLASAFFVGVVAISGLWWTTGWVIESNLSKWSEQWISELDDLGMPLYADGEEDRFLRIEKYVNSFPEMSFVRYYNTSGDLIFTHTSSGESGPAPPLDVPQLEELSRNSGDGAAMIDSSRWESSSMRITKPIWVESMNSIDLLEFGASGSEATEKDLVGYVELGLDFSSYQTQLNRNVLLGSLASIVALIVLAFGGRVLFRRALRPLADLQEPLAQLANGQTNFSVEPSGHSEIVAIADALNTTVSALHERDRRLHRLANHDSLTGLMNRHRFSEALLEELNAAADSRQQSALLFIDLDQFKYINDTLGHSAGDRLLVQAAQRLASAVRKQDLVSRFGGDEFTIFLKGVSRSEVTAICNSLVKDMRDHLFIEDGRTFSIPCSIGVSIVSPEDNDPAELLANADMACNDAKAKGRNRFQVYERSTHDREQMAADVGWSQKIKRALEADSFLLDFQPIVDIGRGQPTHYEVLLRMRGDNGEKIPPGAFLPAASRFGLMNEIDEWLIRNALRRLAAYRRKFGDICFTLNISGNLFDDDTLVAQIRENLERNGLPPEAVILEITEQVAVRNMVDASEQMSRLIDLGCKFAIDDFGAGYSSFIYVKTLPVHFIKIDGTFIREIRHDVVDQTIVRSIGEIARESGKKTIAEYVQDAETLDLLGELGIDYAQGYYVGKPSPRLRRRAITSSLGSARRRKQVAS